MLAFFFYKPLCDVYVNNPFRNRFSLYSGYSDSFRYSGPLQEDAHDDLSSSVVVAMDATNYSWSDQEGQFTEEEVNRYPRTSTE